MKNIILIAMIFIASANSYGQAFGVVNNIPGSALQIKVKGQNFGTACNSSLSALIPLPFGASWLMPTPTSAPFVWTPGVVFPFTYDGIYYEVLGPGGILLCTGTVGKPLCGWVLNQPIPCLPGRFATWIPGAGGAVNVNFH